MTDGRCRESRVRSKDPDVFLLLIICFLFFTFHFLLFTVSAYGEDDIVKFVEKKHIELKEKEETLKKEEERLKALRKDADERIEKYSKLLSQIEGVLKKIEAVKNERMEHLVKAYEAMPSEEAAARLSAMDEQTAVKIILRMKSKRAGAVMALMEPKKVAALTENMTKIVKNFPIK